MGLSLFLLTKLFIYPSKVVFKIVLIRKSTSIIVLKYSKAVEIFKKALKSGRKHSKSTLQVLFCQYFKGFLPHFQTKILRYDYPQNSIEAGFGEKTVPQQHFN